MNWKAQVQEMTGKTFARHGQAETLVKHIEHDQDRVEILTDVDDYEMSASEVPAFLASFTPATRPAKRTAAAKTEGFVPAVLDTSKLQLMQEALMNAIGKVQTNESYVPQAEQIGKLVQVGINLAKLELDAIRISRL